jgi:DNA-directed RNA polymerase subunit RPC12/RpoP
MELAKMICTGCNRRTYLLASDASRATDELACPYCLARMEQSDLVLAQVESVPWYKQKALRRRA